MQPEQGDKLALVFAEAVELPTREERSAFVARACSEDPALCRKLTDLLEAHEAAGRFLQSDLRLEAAARPEPDSVAAVNVGDRLGPYRLIGLIGEGASSIVYVAEQDHPFRRWVALKIIKAGMDTRQVIARFELERQALAVMDHPGIAKVLDAGETPNGRPFFVMELVRGLGITQHCDRHRLTVEDRLGLFIQVCQAVLHAHQKGVVHRDIKPDNVLISLHDGRPFPKVIDFGIAKVLHGWAVGSTPATCGMPFLGTPAYVSPEQAQATTTDLDTRTDIYSLGALLYELLVGHPPFDHQTLMAAGLDEMCQIIRTQEPAGPTHRFAQLTGEEQRAIADARRTTPDELRRTLAGDLEWITLKAIEKNREQRYQTAASLAEDIQRHLDHLPVSAAAPTLPYRLAKLMRRNRRSVATVLAIGVVLLASTVVTSFMAFHARYNARRAGGLQTAAIASERQSRQALLKVHVSSALAASDNGNYDHAALWFANAAQVAGENEAAYVLNQRRVLTWLARSPLPVGAFQLSSGVTLLEFSAGSRYLLAVDRDGNCQVWDCVARTPLPWTSTLGPVRAAAWHPDARTLALVLGEDQVELRSVPDGARRCSIQGGEDVRAVTFSHDGDYLVCGARTARAWDLRAGAWLDRAWLHQEPILGFGFTSLADRFVTVSADSKARVLSLDPAADGRPDVTLPHRPSIRVDSCSSKTSYRQDYLETPVLCVPALGALGTVLVTRTGPYEISAWDVGTGRLIQSLPDMCCSCRFVLSPDSSKLAAGLQGGRLGVWEVATGRQQAVLTSSGACILDVAFSPDGENVLVAQANRVARVWSLRERRPIHSFMHHSAEVDKVAYAADGGMVATVQADGLVRVWILPQAAERGHRLPSAPGPKVVRMDPERRHFVAAREPGWKEELRQATIYSVETGKPIGPTWELDGNLEDVALSPGCRQAAVAFGLLENETAGVLEFREIPSGQVISRTTLLSSASSLSWDPGGERVAAICHSGQLLLVVPGSAPPVTWAQPLELNPGRVHPFVTFSPDGKHLISITPAGAVEVRQSDTGQLRYPPLNAVPDGFRHFAVSHDSRLLASTTRSGQVDVWNMLTGIRHGSPLYHPGPVYRCNFGEDSNLLVTACHDGKCRIWDLRSGQLDGSPMIHPSEVYDASLTPDGLWVLTACHDGAVRIWDRQSGQLIAPRFKVGDQAFTVEVTAEGKYGVIGSLSDSIQVLSLDFLHRPVGRNARELCMLAEVVSGSVLSQGSLRELTTTEWLERFQQLRPPPDAGSGTGRGRTTTDGQPGAR